MATKVRIRKIHDGAVLPRYAHGPLEDAGMDLCSVETVTLAAGETRLVATGLAIELPPGFEAQIRPRSGLALKHSITLPNAPATIDPGYRGEVLAAVDNIRDEDYTVKVGDRLCQAVSFTGGSVDMVVVDSLDQTARGEGGFGSTDVIERAAKVPKTSDATVAGA